MGGGAFGGTLNCGRGIVVAGRSDSGVVEFGIGGLDWE